MAANRNMIWTIQIDLVFGLYAKEDWTAIVEVKSSSTLEDMHHIIQDLVSFDDDHMYEFFISRTQTSRDKRRFEDEEGAVFATTLEDLFPLPKNRKLFYMFDYGDNWLFNIKKLGNRPHAPVEGIEYPRLAKEIGLKPIQYPNDEDNFD